VATNDIIASELTRRDLAYVVFKRKGQILGVFAVTLILVTLGAYLSPRTYVATATVYVVRNLSPIAASAPTSLNIVLDRKEVLNSEVDLITSRAVAEKVADSLDASNAAPSRPAKTPPAFVQVARAAMARISGFFTRIGLTDPPLDQRDARIASLQQAIEAKPGVNSDFISISGSHEDPEYAARMTNTFTRVYLERRLALFKRPGLEEFYDGQILRARAAADELDQKIKTLKAGTGVVTQDEQLRLKLQELSGLNNELNKVRSETQELAERTAALRTRIQSQPDAVMSSRVLQRNPAIVDLEKKAVDFEAEKAQELNRFQRDSPVIQDLDRSIERLQQAASREPATVISSESTIQNTVRTTLLTELYRAEADHQAKEARERTLLRQIESLTREIHTVDGSASDLGQLETAAASAAKIYARYVEQREEARIATETGPGVTNLHVINEATVPSRPKYPRVLLILVGAMMGAFMGFALAFVSELFSHTLNRREDVERALELPVLAVMPEHVAIRQPF
jgi:polysaccharide biosynthesis transport protein